MIFKEFYIAWLVLLFMRISIYCNADEITYNTTSPYLPAIPDNVKAVQVGSSDVLVTWEMPESHRYQNLTHRVFYAPVHYRDKGKFFDVTGSTATIIGSLSQDETYTIQVSSVSFHGQGPKSHPVTVTIQHLDDCLQCKSKEEKIVHCNCSYELLEETCSDACQFKCSNPESFDPADGCKNGCIPGWYGEYCNISCPGMCGECDKVTGRCTTCLSHWMGPYCNETCPPGLYGDLCNKVCHIYCNRCLNQSYCIECKNGRYGESCQNLCHQDCVTCNYEPHKCTSCIRGKFLENGSVCLNCPENCVSCAGRDNCTECQSGKHGPKCQMSCPPNCVTCTSSNQCHECVPNRHGNICQCNSKCGNVTEQCDTGEVCQKGCPPLKMGIYCNHSCPQNCYKCDQLTGACFSCVSGFYGLTCNKTCGHCKPGSKGEIQCNKHTGKCADCLSGWHGWRCDEACSIACQTTFCDRFSGMCDPCVTGFYGPQCTEECNSNCYNVTMSGCDKLSGVCDLCLDGFFGLSCNETCLEYCGTFPCRKQTGVCEKCPSGFYGDKCHKICNQQCSSSNTTKDICHRESGYCIQGCNPGWYNEFCQSPCSVTCIDALCSQDTGLCLQGCIDGFTGDTCNLSIPREYLFPLDVRQIGAKNVLVQWDKLNLTDIELESVKRLVLNHMMSASTNVETHDLPDWKTRTHYLLQEVDVNSKHIFQLVVFFELQSKSPVVSKPAEFELVPRAPDESMLRLTADMDIYEFPDYSYRYDARECTRMSKGENFISTRQYEKIVTEKIKCHVRDDGKYNGVMNATGIWFYKQNNVYRKLAVIDNKTLTWILAHF